MDKGFALKRLVILGRSLFYFGDKIGLLAHARDSWTIRHLRSKSL
jgi:hypothetical protein